MSDVISTTTSAEARQFDFLEGEWNALCRFPLPDGAWGERFEGGDIDLQGSGWMRLGTMFSRGSPGLGAPSRLTTGRVTAP